MLLPCRIDVSELSDFDSLTLLNELAEDMSDEVTDAFVQANICYDDAVNIVVAQDSFRTEFIEWYPLSADELATQLIAQTNDVVHHLVNSHPNEASQLFEELLYYRNKGRI